MLLTQRHLVAVGRGANIDPLGGAIVKQMMLMIMMIR